MVDWLLGYVPPWAWLALGAVVVLAIGAALKGDGWKWSLAAAGVALAAYFQSKSYHRGASVERAKQDQADQRARDVIYDNRAEMDALPDDELDRRLNRWDKS